MNSNNFLNSAKINKKDEFYTRYEDINNELQHYKKYFKGKKIYLNCDDPSFSNFWKYFKDNGEHIGCESITATYLADSSFKYIYNCNTGQITVSQLQGNGDFRSKECIDILQNSDIVITNPPFSLFNDYIQILNNIDIDFIIIGNQNSITNNTLFDMIKRGRANLGIGFKGLAGYFYTPDYEDNASGQHIEDCIRVSGVCWYTSFNVKENNNIELNKPYNKLDYPKYDIYDAVNVNKTADIPFDYYGVMGVPITYIHKHDNKKFKLVGILPPKYRCVNGKKIYARILIQRKDDVV